MDGDKPSHTAKTGVKMRNSTLIIRADAGARIGTGHLMRCLALAQGWQDRGGEVLFVSLCESPVLRQRLLDEGIQVISVKDPYPAAGDWKCLSQILNQHPGAWVVVDGYHFDQHYQARIKEAGHPLLVIDDIAHLDHYYADIVLNQNIHATDLQYSCESYTKLLLGTKYVLLRREFLKWQGWNREIPEIARKVLVTFGGADRDNATLKVIEALQQIGVEEIEAVVVVGAVNSHFKELQSAAQNSRIPIRLETTIKNMPELMVWADVAVSAGGSTCWELAFTGLPNLVLVLAENQRLIAKKLHDVGASVNLGWHADLSSVEIAQVLTNLIAEEKQRRLMAEIGQKLVDGNGVSNVLNEISGHLTLEVQL
ncbi:MAG: UDP-2,4-diacetamido-2,4,6-trideoxy-beta-L-altropyranose hydrolase [Anaerolineae bacterium]|jgi:UDP-2,4-diacetamido-2,4,6-trideoxy-beta-L-altropyranose hydrolase|nr:UDP-2,4-diacetamido-2,4,6-trideoxy-beta-L-altropyranose hydrolase [Anaerolineae bacterium]